VQTQRQVPVGASSTATAEPPRRAGKRLFDIVASGSLLVVVSPLLAVAALAIRLTSRGPVLFRQERVGAEEQPFAVLKLRTMVVDQERVVDLTQVQALEREGVLTKFEDDPRVTRVGRVLRRTSVDELPQLWNVLVGEMSLVGPRPLLPFMLEPYPALRRARCAVRPGLTGLWQVSQRNDNTTALGMAAADLQYISEPSVRQDALILLRTVPALIKGTGAM